MGDDSQSKRVYEQIEQSADFYQPALYELLTFYHSLENQSEPLDGQFVPMTTVQNSSPKDVKIFAVGLIPPPSHVTGRLLDRTASILAAQDDSALAYQLISPEAAEAAEVEEIPGNASSDSTLNISRGPNRSTVEPKRRVADRSNQLLSGLHPSIAPLAQKLLAMAAEQGISLVINQGFRTYAEQDALFAKGRTEPGGVVTGTKGGESWHNFGLAFDVAMVSPGPKPPIGNPSWPPGKDVWSTVGALGQSIGLIWGGSFSSIADYGHFEFHPGVTKAQARNGVRPAAPAGEPTPITGTAPSNPTWRKTGSDNAQEASRTISLAANLSLNRENLGKRFDEQQLSTIKLMQAALDQMARTPPLRLLVNPQSLRVQASKIISDGNWGRNGPIVEHWGEEQDKIEASGKIAAFYSMDAYDANGPGLTRTARQFSSSYQNLMSLWLIYKNNGGIWFPDPISPSGSRAKNLSVVGSVYLYYDEILYIGSFDNFSITEAEGSPFSLEYSFSFSVRAWYILDHMDDRQYMYGQDTTQKPLLTGAATSPTFGGNNAQPSPNVALPTLSTANDPLFGINDGDIGDNLEGI